MSSRVNGFSAVLVCLALSACGGGGSGSSTSPPTSNNSDPSLNQAEAFVTFESAAVRPVAISDDGSRLFVTNTPNSTLDIFTLTDAAPVFEMSVAVGLEPVAVATRKNEVWVVNHLSDSVSIVDVSTDIPHVVNTLLVGDEPRDIVFAGSDGDRAFITAAHRGQNGPNDQPIDAQLTTPSVARADVWVFDASNTGASIGGDPVDVVSMFGDTPRALSASADGSRVFAAVMNSGNRTTTIGEANIAKAGPVTDKEGNQQPDTGLIVQFDGITWRDETGSATDLNNVAYDERVKFSLPDYDVFELSANGSVAVIDKVAGVGTTLFNMIVNPVSGELYVTNTEALNVNRFEGEGLSSSSVRGNFAKSRISIISDAGVSYRNLNKHLDHSQPVASAQERQMATVQPMDMAITEDGSTLFVTGFGSDNVVAYNTQALSDDSYAVSAATQVTLSGGGPVGIAIDETRGQLYVLTRFNNSIAVIDMQTLEQTSSVAMANPEPAHVVAGRPFLYNATNNSSHGDSSCGLCHVGGDNDGLAWDLGNPDLVVVENPNRFVNGLLVPAEDAIFHPLKGPMATQSFRGMAGNGPMHWRGDRTGRNKVEGESLEQAAFKEFNAAFPELLGRDTELTEEEMTLFAQFALEITYPPNPIRALDNSLTSSQRSGKEIYLREPSTGDIFQCNTCHLLDASVGAFGTGGRSSVEGDDISQEFKVPHLRNMYQKVGKFGNSGRFAGDAQEFGDQIRGFGFMHDGHMDTLDNFFKGTVFHFDDDPATNDKMRSDVVDFVMAIDSDLAPIVGQQVTLTASSDSATSERINLLMDRASQLPKPECDLIAKGIVEGEARGFLMTGVDNFDSDKQAENYSFDQLRAIATATDGAITFTCVPPGSGPWMGIDRNSDGVRDSDSLGSDQGLVRPSR